jgi:TolA-binding protein
LGYYLTVVLLAIGLSMTGCGGAEEATQAEGQTQDQARGTDEKKDENPYGQALTSFVGEEKKEQPKEQKQPEVVQPQANATYEKQIDDLRTENTSLKQRIVKLEQDNRTLNARLADSEAKLAAEKERADKAEAAAKSMPMTAQRGTKVEAAAETKSMPPMDVSSYEDALKAFNAKQYTNAMNGLQALLAGGVAEDWADNCKYWIGECQFATKKYADAIKSFEEVLAYKNSEKKADAQFMIAQAYDRMGKKAEAKEAYEKVVKDYPTNRNVKKAKDRWAKL